MYAPPVRRVQRRGTHRLIPTRMRPGGDSVLARIADDDDHLAELFDLDHATNDRLLAENDLAPGIGVRELVFGIPNYRIINAAFCHPHPLGARFNGPERGAWYAAFELATSQAEVIFHKTVQLAEINRYDDEVSYDDYHADIDAELHDLRDDRRCAPYLKSDNYRASQALAEQLLDAGALGVVYPSVRRDGGTCLACFRPALVTRVRRARTYVFRWDGSPKPKVVIRED
ncbi:RES family NAD+ phosphorylase [Solimonas marina]|uniref:RES family NAD+ phosphorylase n=1 Tax=Solimonas marina TaxID=2714601 RepID=A0A969W6E3_9GAMM|nr:RES family NAD+ phosphorylase [Solimonas marina]NKF21252.1 RES family NAD+ phosphorylase [Solimonas marina]